MDKNRLLELIEPIEAIYSKAAADCLINMAAHFKSGKKMALSEWQMKKFAEINALDAETVKLIKRATKKQREIIASALTEAIDGEIAENEPQYEAAEKKTNATPEYPPLFESAAVAEVTAVATAALLSTFAECADTLVDFTVRWYTRVISDVVSSESRNAQSVSDVVSTDIGAEEIRQSAITEALGRLMRNRESIPVFVDRAGREWSAEGYVSMCSRTELHNATIDAQRARAEETGHTVFQVSAHAGARPLCAPYQGRYYTWERGGSGVIHTIDGKAIPYDSVYNTSYGEPAGLFGINCGHRPMTKIDGFFYDNLKPLTEEELRENDRIYAESQRQRSLERRIRNAKTQAVVYDAAGDEQAFAKMAAQVKRAQEAYKNYCREVGRTPRQNRTQVDGYDRSMSQRATQAIRRAQRSAPTTDSSTLTEAELRAINTYIGSPSYLINEHFRKGTELSDYLQQTVKDLDSALKKMPKYSGDVYRSVEIRNKRDLEKFLTENTVGAIVDYKEYLSTTKNEEFYNPDANIQIYILNSTKGRDISEYNPKENEVLYERGSRFRVAGIDENNGVVYLLYEEL